MTSLIRVTVVDNLITTIHAFSELLFFIAVIIYCIVDIF